MDGEQLARDLAADIKVTHVARLSHPEARQPITSVQ